MKLYLEERIALARKVLNETQHKTKSKEVKAAGISWSMWILDGFSVSMDDLERMIIDCSLNRVGMYYFLEVISVRLNFE